MKTKRILQVMIATFFIGVANSTLADTFTANYLGGGIWEQDPNWSTTVYPNNGRTRPGPNGEPIPGPNPLYNVTIDNPSLCTLGIGVRVEAVNILQGSTLNLGNGGYLWANTGFANAGLITLNSAGNFTGLLRSGADSDVVAGGEIFMSDHGSNSVTAGGTGKVLTIAAGGRIRGAGNVNAYHGDDVRTYFQIVNHGLIEAMQPINPLRIFLTDDAAFPNSMINDGTLRASGQGVLYFSNFNNFANVLNQGGTIEAIDNGTVRVRIRSTIIGGTLATSGNGTIRGDYGQGVGGGGYGGTFKDVVNTGTIVLGTGENLGLAGTFTNNGQVRIDGNASDETGLLMRSPEVTLAGNGVITMNATGGIAGGDTPGQTMIVNNGFTIRGNGSIGTLSSAFLYKPLRLVNHGLVESTAGMTIYVRDADNTNVTNDGTLRAANGASFLQFNGPGAVVNNNGGTIEALGNSNLLFTGGATLTNNAGATIALNGGTLTVEQGLDLNGGSLIGHGMIEGPVRNNGGTISPGFSPGKITVNGNYTQGANGTLNIEISGAAAGTGYDQLQVNGTAALGGTLNLSLINGFLPAVGDVFSFILPSAFTGAFSTINTTGFTGQVNYSANAITITVLSVGGVTPTPSPSKLLNIATRMRVQTGENVLIGGFIITGTDSKNVIIRGIGPSLSSFFSGVLANPTLELFQGSTLLQSNNDWKDTQRIEVEATGLQPSNDFESAILRTLPPGSYTAIVRGFGNTTGIGVVEAYDLNQTANSKLANIATRGFVEAGDNVMIGGLIIGPGAGSTARAVVRAIGPSLTAFGIAGALQDPTVELKDVNGSTLSNNDDWQQGQLIELQQLGLAPTDTRESALVTTLAPGAYTAIVRGAGNTTGVGLVEVYHVQ